MNNNIANTDSEEIYKKALEYFHKNHKLKTFDWLEGISERTGIVEVAFKNTRKAFFVNEYDIPIRKGDIVAVEATTGHDIGMVSLTGFLAEKQFNRKIRKKDRYKFLKIWRKATTTDLEKFLKAKERELSVRNRARSIAKDLAMDMKISDVEMQGDNTKAIFYFLADGRIDFRDLIKTYAREFHVKIEMKQIGARQEAAMIGGLDLSGREFCGSTWKTEFESVKSNAAKLQQLHMNDPKLIDHSGNLKTSLMYELDNYIEAWREIPSKIPPLETMEGTYYPHKIDVLERKIWVSMSKDTLINPMVMPVEQVKTIMKMNEKGEKPPLTRSSVAPSETMGFSSGQAELKSINEKKRKKSGRKKKRRSSRKIHK